MKAALKVVVLSCALLALTGCGMNAKWEMKSITPATASEHFGMKVLCLMDDGTYMACAVVKDKPACLAGTYTYDNQGQMLTFKDKDGQARSYHAKLLCPGGEMKIWSDEQGKEWTATMKRAGDCPKNCCGGGPCDHKMCQPRGCDPKKCDPKMCDPKACPAKKAGGDAPKGGLEKNAPTEKPGGTK